MLAAFRKIANTWPARIFFIILAVSFASWGVADVARRIATGGDNVAVVGGHEITPNDFYEAYQAAMKDYAAQFPDPAQIPEELRARVASETLQQLITQKALVAQEDRLGVVAPDSAVRAAVFAMPAFQGPDGQFSRAAMLQTLSSHELTEARFLDEMRDEMRQNQVIDTLTAAIEPPKLLIDRMFRYLQEKRRADVVFLGFAGQVMPPPPADAVLHRYYENNPDKFVTREFRHVKAVVLSPQTIGRGLNIPEAELRAWFDQHKADYQSPEKRSAQVIVVDKQDAAAKLAAMWRAGADWAAMQAAAKPLGATPVPLDNIARTGIASPELAQAVFAASPGAVVGPVKQALGFYVLKVTTVTPAKITSFDAARDTLHDKVAAEKAIEVIDERAQKLQDLFAGGARIDEVPADLGASGAEGTLDAQGNTKDGQPAPLPTANDDARKQIIAAAFQAKPGDQITPVEGPDHIWYAIAVDSIEPAARKPYEDARPDVLLEWQRDQVRHQVEAEAAHLLTLVHGGQTLTNAAWGSGLQVTPTPLLSRGRAQGELPAELIARIFMLKHAEAIEAEAPNGFYVLQLSEVDVPDPQSDPMGMKQSHDELVKALNDETLHLFAEAIRAQVKLTVHPELVSKLIQPNQQQ